MNIIDGKSIAGKIREEIEGEVAKLKMTPGLAVILVGSDPASHLYVSLKEKASREAGIYFEKHLFFATEPEEKIIKKIEDLNDNPKIHGILVQLPLPTQFDENKIIKTIDPEKDVDGFHPENIKKFISGQKNIVSPLILGVMKLIDSTSKEVKDKKIAILANSEIFSKQLEKMFEGNDVAVSLTEENHKKVVRDADIIIVALGKAKTIKKEMVKDDTIIIDIGTNRLPDGKTIGDVDIETFKGTNCWVTPVPGGVGPITVAMLLKNILEMAKK